MDEKGRKPKCFRFSLYAALTCKLIGYDFMLFVVGSITILLCLDGWGGRKRQYSRFSLHAALTCELMGYNSMLFVFGSIMFLLCLWMDGEGGGHSTIGFLCI